MYYTVNRQVNKLKGEIDILDDYILIKHTLSKELPYINIYPIGDLHLGSGNFCLESFNKWKKLVSEDPYSKIVIVGDMIDNGLKTSKTNSFEASMQPFQQKKWLEEEFRPFADKIIGVVQGNHEYRSSIVADFCPLYDVMAKLDLEDLYRPNMAFIKVNLGERNADRQCSYTIMLTHGASKTKTNNFGYAVDGMDIMVTGHIHQPSNTFPAKIVIDSKNESVSLRSFTHVTVPSFQKLGGYALKGMFLPQSMKIPIIRLDGTKKEVNNIWI